MNIPSSSPEWEDISTVNASLQKIIVSQQPLLGSCLNLRMVHMGSKSVEGLKFNLYDRICSTSVVKFYNLDLSIGNRQIATLRKDPLDMVSKNVLVGVVRVLLL